MRYRPRGFFQNSENMNQTSIFTAQSCEGLVIFIGKKYGCLALFEAIYVREQGVERWHWSARLYYWVDSKDDIWEVKQVLDRSN